MISDAFLKAQKQWAQEVVKQWKQTNPNEAEEYERSFLGLFELAKTDERACKEQILDLVNSNPVVKKLYGGELPNCYRKRKD